jgi:hypothetical protein
MSLASIFDEVMASCVHVPQYPVHEFIHDQQFQMKVKTGVNKVFYRSFAPVTLEFDCPSPPATIIIKCYENYDLMPSTDPIWSLAGFLATCATPGTFLGTSRWWWMATYGVAWGAEAYVPFDWVHLQNFKTNVQSIGLVPYPLTPEY